jgi:branched-chain amino acid transport system ATP-binding protein
MSSPTRGRTPCISVSDALALRDVDAFYGDSHVLHRIGFHLRAGSLLALLGRNGAGKTTCLNAVMGFLRPRRGSIVLFGETISKLSPEAIARRGVGLVPQGRRVFPSLTVRENLLVAQRGERDAAWTMDRVFKIFPRLSERRHQHAGLLSGGEQQMLAIGRALMGNPRVLLLDEPSEGLAPQIVAEVARIIARLKAEQLSIVLVEQNVRLALSLADDVAVVNTGAVVFQGTPAQIAADETMLNRHLGVF